MHKLARSMNKLLIRIPNVRYASGYDLPADIEALFAEPKYNAKFQEERNRVIHETNEDFAKPMVANLYPGSLAVPKSPEDELGLGDKPTGVWERITFFGDKKPNKLFIEVMPCPQLLQNIVCAIGKPVYDILKPFHIVQTSFAMYEDKEVGRHDCYLATKEIMLALQRGRAWAYYSGSIPPYVDIPAQKGIFFKPNLLIAKHNDAQKLHAKVKRCNECIHVSDEPFDETVGLIYTNHTHVLTDLTAISFGMTPRKGDERNEKHAKFLSHIHSLENMMS